jgi:uncharacterized delta-60 repeat protein
MMTVDRDSGFGSFAKLLPLFALVWAALTFSTKAVAQAGQLDKTFGKGGIFLGQNAGLSTSIAVALAIQTDGKILIAGQTPSLQAGVFRLTANGALDTSFGTGGMGVIPHSSNLGAVGFLATGVVIQPDGKIVLAISSSTADALPVLELVRFNSNGSLDTNFGLGGIVLLVRGGPNSSSLAQQPDGKILVAGGSLMARTDANGNLDTSFGTSGFAALISGAASIALQPDGHILLGASRYDMNGSLDTPFGISGRAATLGPVLTARLQSDGKIVAVGGITSKVSLGQVPTVHTDTGFGVIRYTPTGIIDAGFGHDGEVITDFSGFAPTTIPSDMAIQSNGSIIVAGQAAQPDVSTFVPGPAAFALARYTTTGQLDDTFGPGGKVITILGSNLTAGIAAVTLDSRGRLVTAGNVSSGGNPGNIAVARYLTQ